MSLALDLDLDLLAELESDQVYLLAHGSGIRMANTDYSVFMTFYIHTKGWPRGIADAEGKILHEWTPFGPLNPGDKLEATFT